MKIDYEKLNRIWMCTDTSGEPMIDPFNKHWVLNVGDVVVEATTREGCLEMARRGENSLKSEVLKHDIQRFGATENDLERLSQLQPKKKEGI